MPVGGGRWRLPSIVTVLKGEWAWLWGRKLYTRPHQQSIAAPFETSLKNKFRKIILIKHSKNYIPIPLPSKSIVTKIDDDGIRSSWVGKQTQSCALHKVGIRYLSLESQTYHAAQSRFLSQTTGHERISESRERPRFKTVRHKPQDHQGYMESADMAASDRGTVAARNLCLFTIATACHGSFVIGERDGWPNFVNTFLFFF